MKRYRDERGNLIKGIEQIKKEVQAEVMEYYKPGSIYLYKKEEREYVYCIPEPGDVELAHFQSFDGYNLFIPVENLGTFLPDVASEGMELVFVE